MAHIRRYCVVVAKHKNIFPILKVKDMEQSAKQLGGYLIGIAVFYYFNIYYSSVLLY